MYPGIELLFNELDEHNKGELDKVDMKLIMKDLQIKIKESDYVVLMNHLGNGEVITMLSLKEVISIQKNK
jgi:Ca2+-binding EF-hand superfamily protein